MAVDDSAGMGNPSADTATADVSTNATADSGTQTATPDVAGATDASTAQPRADAAPVGKPGSSTNPNATSQNPQNGFGAKPTPAGSPNGTNQPQAIDWQKRLSNFQQEAQQRINRLEMERRQEQTEFQRLRQFEQMQRQQAEAQKLKSWSKQHPDHGKFQSLLTRAQTVRQQLGGIDPKLPPEQQELARNAILSALTPEDQSTLQEYQQESQTFQRDFFTDPRGTIAPILREEIQNAFNQYRVHQQAQAQVDRDFKELEPVLQQHGPEMAAMLQRGTPYDVAVENLKLKAELGALQSRAGDVEKARAAANEQQRLAKGQASITRDPVPTSKPDIFGLAKKEAAAKGIATDDPRFMGIVSRIEERYKQTSL